jgi:ubiquinone/menaquinone biosynthesis C-methylase UbiE
MSEPPPTPLRRIDYDEVQHNVYAQGRSLRPAKIRRYMEVFARYLPARRPLEVIDLGSGTGRFSPALAEAFGGPVHGVEPAGGMRRAAEVGARHPRVRYLEGEAAAIPLASASADFLLMFLSFHHVPDRAAAAREIARVLTPGGRFILRSTFRERIPDHWWRGFFPSSWAVEEAMFPSVSEVRALFEPAGFMTVESVQMEIPFDEDLDEEIAKLRLRAVSVFEHMSPEHLDEGFAQLEAAYAAGTIERKPTFGDFVVFERR